MSAWGGYTLAYKYYAPKLQLAHEQLGALNMTNTALRQSIEQQNSAVAALTQQAQQRQQMAEAATRQAQTRARQTQRQAQAVLLLKPPAGADPCRVSLPLGAGMSVMPSRSTGK